MLFNSISFALFLPLVFAVYWGLPARYRNTLLLVASYIFYGAWDYRFLSLLGISTITDYLIGRGLGATDDEGRRKRLLLASVAVNLGILAGFKYYGFFVDSALGFLGMFGLEPNPPLLQIVLPVGISFYTFQTLSYTFDVFRRRIEPTRDLLTFAVYVSYFPQLVAGPIERARRLLPQLLDTERRLSAHQARSGAFLVLLGLFKKVAIADAVAPIVDGAFAAGSSANSAQLFIGLFAFSIQVYGDFSGYTDIARGVSRLFGIELMRNFEQPWLSRNITEFWRTWHISLSTWLHDYLYVPLGGNQRGRFATYRNLMLTMTLGGLWHGAEWTMVTWGALHGLFLAMHRRFGSYVPRGLPGPVSLSDAPRVVATFVGIALTWPFFRGQSMTAAWDYFAGLVDVSWAAPNLDDLLLLTMSALAVLAIDIAQRRSGKHVVVLGWRPTLRGLAYASLALYTVVWAGDQAQPFIYFQF